MLFKRVLFVAFLVVSVYLLYAYWLTFATDEDIEAYAVQRIEYQMKGRNAYAMAVVKMPSYEACQKDALPFIRNVLNGDCENCAIREALECRIALNDKFQKAFSGEPLALTYLRTSRQYPLEYHSRLLFWGMTSKEATQKCSEALVRISNTYKSAKSCVVGTLE